MIAVLSSGARTRNTSTSRKCLRITIYTSIFVSLLIDHGFQKTDQFSFSPLLSVYRRDHRQCPSSRRNRPGTPTAAHCQMSALPLRAQESAHTSPSYFSGGSGGPPPSAVTWRHPIPERQGPRGDGRSALRQVAGVRVQAVPYSAMLRRSATTVRFSSDSIGQPLADQAATGCVVVGRPFPEEIGGESEWGQGTTRIPQSRWKDVSPA